MGAALGRRTAAGTGHHGALIFGLLFGLPGIILATPLMVVAMVLVQQLYVEGLLKAGHEESAAP